MIHPLSSFAISRNKDGLFLCDVRDSQKDIFEGKPPKNLDFKKQKSKVILNISKTILKACVHYFLSNFYFSPNDSPSKTMKNIFYFI